MTISSIFLSHNSRDKDFVRKLAYRFVQAGVKVWIDEAELDIGDSIIERVSEGIYESDFVVAVISKHSVRSKWVQKELSLAMTSEVSEQRIRVLPVVIDNSRAEMPFMLRDKVFADFSQPNSFDAQFGLLLRAILKQQLKTSSYDPVSAKFPVGEQDIGGVVHTDGKAWVAYNEVANFRYQGLRFLIMGSVFFILLRIMLQFDKKAAFLYWACACSITLVCAGVLLMSRSMWLKLAIEVDVNLLLQMETMGSGIKNNFDKEKWRISFQLAKNNPRYRIALYLGIACIIMLLLSVVFGLISLFIV